MRPAPLLTTAITAVYAAGALAFAPAGLSDSEGAAGPGSSAVHGVEVSWLLDDDPTTQQPIVLELLDDVTQAGETGGSERWSRHGFAYAYVQLGEHCGDLGGPEDQELVRDVVRFLRGELAGEDGTVLDGSDGRVAAYAADHNAHLLLSAATSTEDPPPLRAVATTGALVDRHDADFSHGNVRRNDGLDPLAEPSLCDRDPAADRPDRSPYWQARDVVQRARRLTAPTLLVHDGASPYGLEHTQRLWNELSLIDDATGDGPLRMLRLDSRDPGPRWGNPNSGDELLDHFIVAHLGIGDQVVEARRALADAPAVRLATGAAPCAVPVVCDGEQDTVSLEGPRSLLQQTSEASLFLNRTFEQDLDCTPVCVPGPGTGEVGTLEPVNRFTAPHAPVFTWVDGGVDSELLTADDPLNQGEGVGGIEPLPGGHGYHSLYFETAPVDEPTMMIGSPVLEGWFSTGSAGGTITPILMDVDTGGATTVVARGALDLDYARGLDAAAHEPGWKPGRVVFDGTVHQLGEGHRLAIVLQSQNLEWYETGTPQGTVNVATGPVQGVTVHGSVLHLPLLPGE